MDMEVVADYGNVVGEGPTWDPRERRLYWIDIPNGRIFRYDPASGEHAEDIRRPDDGRVHDAGRTARCCCSWSVAR